MTRLTAMLVALVFAFSLASATQVIAQTSKAPTKSEKAATEKPAMEKKEASKGAKLDLNTASEAELRELPGIGESYAKKIVENRPYKRKDEIIKKAGVPKATYDKIKDHIVAHQMKASSGTTSAATKKK